MQVFEEDVVSKVTLEWKTVLELQASETLLMKGARKGWVLMRKDLIRIKSGVFNTVRKFKLKEKS